MLRTIEKAAMWTLIASVAVLTLVGVLSIWDVLEDDVLGKTLSTIALVTFSSVIVLVVTKVMEKHWEDRGNNTPPAPPNSPPAV